MKKTALFIIALCTTWMAGAQTMNIVTGSVITAVTASADAMTYTEDGTQLTVCGKTFSVSDIGRIYIDETSVSDNTVSITYSGTSATVVVAGNIAANLTVTVSGAKVAITQDANVTEEITYTLSGTATNGQFWMDGELKASVVLNGVSITCADDAAINIRNGKRISVQLVDGTTSTLVDGASGSQKACFVVKGHTEFKGGGTLNITGKAAHAFWGKEYVQLKASTGAINILGAVGDGFNVNQYYEQNGGTVSIKSVGDDGIQVSYETDDDGNVETDDDNTGELAIHGGSLTVTNTATASKALKSEGAILIDDAKSTPTVTITTSGGVDTSNSNDLGASACIKSDKSITIDAGTVTLTNSGQGGRAMNSDGTITINGGTINASAKGSNYGSSSGGGGGGGGRPGGGPGGGGSSSSSHKYAKGVKCDGVLTITDGTITISSSNHEGMESKGAMNISGGTIYVTASDDAINSAGDMTISGGYVYAYSTGNDGVDSNGNMYLKGGVIIGFGAGGAEAGLDVAENKKMYFTGGQIFGIGGRVDGYPTSTTGSQAYGYTTSSLSCSSGGYYVLSQGSTRIFAVKVPTSYSGIILVSSPSMSSGTSYTVGTATSVSGTAVNGFVLSPTVSSVSNTKSFTARQ